ncbi:hypothetical protein ACIRVK_39710 [Streptomyces sp. NPDC101152]|uniref:MmyB family transcriptional regulator n=1 Tax=Streptomyces sp. NPDC101152 TaxID=3366116 RepID=UPI00380CAE6F
MQSRCAPLRLAHNALAAALHSGFQRFDNLARMVFLDPAGCTFYQDWDKAANSCVAQLRAAYGHDPDASRITEFVDTLCAKSPEFAGLWAQHEVRGKTQQAKNRAHPEVGALEIQFSAFTVNGAPQQRLVVYQAEPASATAAALAELHSPVNHEESAQVVPLGVLGTAQPSGPWRQPASPPSCTHASASATPSVNTQNALMAGSCGESETGKVAGAGRAE